jgi:hypothetical protein
MEDAQRGCMVERDSASLIKIATASSLQIYHRFTCLLTKSYCLYTYKSPNADSQINALLSPLKKKQPGQDRKTITRVFPQLSVLLAFALTERLTRRREREKERQHYRAPDKRAREKERKRQHNRAPDSRLRKREETLQSA